MLMFDTGKIVTTIGIKEATKDDENYANEIFNYFVRYLNGDWGNLCQEDIDANNEAILNGNRVLAAYNSTKGKIYIITEHDRSYTTLLFANEY